MLLTNQKPGKYQPIVIGQILLGGKGGGEGKFPILGLSQRSIQIKGGSQLYN